MPPVIGSSPIGSTMTKRTYHIWSEGYAATCEKGGPYYEGEMEGESFEDACHRLLQGRDYYDKRTNTMWGMKLYEAPHPGWA